MWNRRIFNGSELRNWGLNSVTKATVQHHETCWVTEFSICTKQPLLTLLLAYSSFLRRLYLSLNMCYFSINFTKYRRLSLSRSPGDQTKYFELSVVWDSQFVTSVTLYMYTDCLDHCDYNLHVHVFGNDVLEFKYPLTELLISDTNFEKPVTEIKECWWLLTSKNAVKQCSITKVTKAPLHTLWV